MHPTEIRRAVVRGLQLATPGNPPFVARLDLELREDCVYYTWRAESHEGDFLAEQSQPVSFRTIPQGTDRFEFALSHASESINRYRLGREPQFQVTEAGWSPHAA